MRRETKEWVLKAETDWISARDLADAAARAGRINHDVVCFLCQQSAEKYFKALMQELRQVVPRTHDLEGLLKVLLVIDPTLAGLRRPADILTPYAVEYRYPGVRSTKRQAQAAIRHAEKVRAAIRGRLGLPV